MLQDWEPKMRTLSILALILVLAPSAAAQGQHELSLMPMPSSVQLGTGQLSIGPSFSVATSGFQDDVAQRGIQRFMAGLSRQTGFPFKQSPVQSGDATLTIHIERGSDSVAKLGEDESYELTVTDSGAKLTAPNPLGILRGLQTILQLVRITSNGFAIPALKVKDAPSFPWRGLLVDPGRHFIPMAVLKRNLDGMESVKMNVLHLHLTDNEGFRVESRQFPKLHGMGSDGLYYTQDDIRELVAYARDRGIRIL